MMKKKIPICDDCTSCLYCGYNLLSKDNASFDDIEIDDLDDLDDLEMELDLDLEDFDYH